MKKIAKLLLVLTATALLLLGVTVLASAEVYEDLYYTISNGEVTITGWRVYPTELTIPDSIDGYPVTGIGANAFADCTGLTSVDFGNSITEIGSKAFDHCNRLTTLTIPDSVANIGAYAFCECTGLTSVSFGKSVTQVGSGAFFGCTGLTSVAIPDSVARIEDYAFYNCTGLESVIIGKSVWRIGSRAFAECSGLTSVVIPDSVSDIADYAFYNCTGLKTVTIGESVEYVGDHAFNNCTHLTEINWNARSVRDFFSYYAVFENAGIAEDGIEVIFGDSVESIPTYMFHCYAENIKSITIGISVTRIGAQAFSYCSQLSQIHWNAKAVENLKKDADVFTYSGNNRDGITVVFGDSVESIPAYLFYSDSGSSPKITDITIGRSVEKIGYYAFAHCTFLKNVYFNNPDCMAVMDRDFLGDRQFSHKATIYSHAGYSVEAFAHSEGYNFVAMHIPVEEWTITATCIQPGQKYHACEFCDEKIDCEDVPALDHDFSSGWIIDQPATCTTTGTKTLHCSRCDLVAGSTEIPALGHDYIEVVTPPTCTKSGYTTCTCSLCGDTYTTDDVEATGHSESDWTVVTPAEIAIEGEEQKVCIACGEILEKRAIPALTQPTTDESTTSESTTVESTTVESTTVESTTVESTTAESTTAESTTSDSAELIVADENGVSVSEDEKEVSADAVDNKGLTAGDLRDKFENDGVVIVNRDGEVLEDSVNVGTGCVIQLFDGERLLVEYVVIVPMDVDGDGVITAQDARLALRAAAQLELLDSVCQQAANVDDDEAFSAADARKILRKAANLE